MKRDWFATTMCATNASLADCGVNVVAAVDTQIIGIHFVELITCARSIHSQHGSDFLHVCVFTVHAHSMRLQRDLGHDCQFHSSFVRNSLHCTPQPKRNCRQWIRNKWPFAGCTVHALSSTGKNNSISIWCEHSSRFKRCIYAKSIELLSTISIGYVNAGSRIERTEH